MNCPLYACMHLYCTGVLGFYDTLLKDKKRVGYLLVLHCINHECIEIITVYTLMLFTILLSGFDSSMIIS